MFSITRDELVIGGNLWVIRFDPNATSLEEIGLPKQFEYAGRYSPPDGSPNYLRLYNKDKNKQFRIDIDDGYSTFNTGFYLISSNKVDLFRRIARLQKSNMSSNIKYISKMYVKFLKDQHPEYVI